MIIYLFCILLREREKERKKQKRSDTQQQIGADCNRDDVKE